MNDIQVHKFGGTSMGSASRIARAAALIAPRTSPCVVVASAMSGVTDTLLGAAARALAGDRAGAFAALEELLRRHLETLDELGGDEAIADQLRGMVDTLRELLGAVSHLCELTPRIRDRIVAAGEKLSIPLLAHALCVAGREATPIDADTFLATDGNHGEANPLQVVYQRTTRAALLPHLEAGVVPVVTGFCGQGPDGATTTLGRGGSDYTATLLAGALDAVEVTLWTDVDGVFSADPRVVSDARRVAQLHYREAGELSYYGAKVLHQRTMIPVATKDIPVYTRNSFHPERPGTVVDGRFSPGSHPVKAISAIRGQQLLSVEGKGMAGVPGVAARAFGALAERGVSVTMISQSSSESSITLAVPTADALDAETALKAAFRRELGRGDVEEIVSGEEVGLVAAVGLGMAHTPGVAARIFTALGAGRVNILAIAQGSSELNVSIAVARADVDTAVRALHRALGLHLVDTGAERPDGLDLVVLGIGSVGRAVIDQLQSRRDDIAARYGVHARVVGLADRSGYLLAPTGFEDTALDGILAEKAAGRSLVDQGGETGGAEGLVSSALELRLSRPVLVDCTDAETAELFHRAISGGWDVVTANKKPLAGPLEVHRSLFAAAADAGRLLRAEATVGAGLPVIDTLEILQQTGDRLLAAEGCLSGTLGYLMARLQRGERLSDAVAEAARLGYTEPDPVADLCGADVGRKAIILGRLSGLIDESAPVEVTGLVPDDWAGLPLAELLERVRGLDAEIAARVAAATAAGEVLRYVAHVSAEGIRVGMVAVSAESPIGRLDGSDNLVSFRSVRYDERPLVVIGPGAGIDVTAMGVLGDVLRVAGERKG